jgi:hypothetical protein
MLCYTSSSSSDQSDFLFSMEHSAVMTHATLHCSVLHTSLLLHTVLICIDMLSTNTTNVSPVCAATTVAAAAATAAADAYRYWTRQALEDGAWHVSEYSAALQNTQQCEPLAMTRCMQGVLSKMSVEVTLCSVTPFLHAYYSNSIYKY